jgi:probable rRNA maturation factor
VIIVDIQDLQDGIEIDGDLVGDWAQRALMVLNMNNAELSVVLTDDAHIQELNRDYLHRDRPTNVISFPQQEGVGPEGTHLGDIVISVERAADEAHDSGMDTMERLMQLLVHGICHLTGYNHEEVSEEEAREMEEAEQYIRRHLLEDA